MSAQIDSLINDLAPFADLGTEAPTVTVDGNKISFKMIRDGLSSEFKLDADGRIIELTEGINKRHASFKALLASPRFADLGRWADSQSVFLRERISQETIEVKGRLTGNSTTGGVELFDQIVSTSERAIPSVALTVVDGPAGIGKTSVIRALSYQRAKNYRITQKPLVLHVESRGRMLQNLTDLMAFALQTLRLNVTYDQILPLVRHGLVVLAIDGFDELGDPNGYDLAWAQVNDLINESRGEGSIILAGRETFISVDRLRAVLTAMNTQGDTLSAFSIIPLSPSAAKNYLKEKGWPQDIFDTDVVQGLFDKDSYALRPFFLNELAREGTLEQLRNNEISDLLSFLIEAMISREAGKFGRDVEAATTEESRKLFIRTLMEEIARDSADNQTDAISVDSLAWISEIAANKIMPLNVLGILKNRVGVIAFLIDDDRRGHRRFVHEQVANYFLSHSVTKSIITGDVPKFIRRNLIGLDFLESFCSVSRKWDDETCNAFTANSLGVLKQFSDYDRTRRNIAAILLSASSVMSREEPIIIENLSVDEVFFTETVSPIELKDVTINQLIARESDFRSVEFLENCHVISLVADEKTLPPVNIPLPSYINLFDETLHDPIDIKTWLASQFLFSYGADLKIAFVDAIGQLPLFELLHRVARYKAYWIKRDDEDRVAKRILDDPYWDVLLTVMRKHNLIQEKMIPASGRPSTFFHIKNRHNLLEVGDPVEDVRDFLTDLLRVSLIELKQREEEGKVEVNGILRTLMKHH